MESLVLEEARRRIAEAKIAEVQLTDDRLESNGNNELKNTITRLGAASRGAESQGVTDWLHNGSVKRSSQSQLNVADTDPHACASVDATPMGTSLSVNPEGVFIKKAHFEEMPHFDACFNNNQVCLGLAYR